MEILENLRFLFTGDIEMLVVLEVESNLAERGSMETDDCG